MKTLRFLACALLLSNGAVLPLTAQPAAKGSAKTLAEAADAPRFTISWEHSRPAALVQARRQLDHVARRAKLGNIDQEEVEIIAMKVAELERQAPPLITVTSKGGQLAEFVAVASRSDEVSLTLINAAEPSDLETPIPAFELRNVNWETVINVLGSFLHARALALKVVGGDSPNPAEAKSVICTLNRHQPQSDKAKAGGASEFESIQLVEHIGGTQSVEMIVDAIRSAWELDPARDPAALRLKFHPGTKLLLVSGPAPTSLIVRHVIAGLQKNPAQR